MQRAWKAFGPLAVLAVVGAALRFWRLGTPELIGDESYYWLWSRHLDWAYFDHPAGVSLTVWLSTALGGQSEAGVRWLNALLGVAGIVLTYALGARLLSHRAGLAGAAVVAVGAPYLVTSRYVYTDALQLVLLLVNLHLFWRIVEQRGSIRWSTALAFGASLALAFNTKYSAYLYAAGLLAAVLLEQRWLLADRKVWVAGLIATTGLLPVLGWNAAHDWASFRWQLAHATFALGESSGLLGNVWHALGYLTWPVVAIALVGVGCVRRPAERLLSLVAAALVLPVGLSPVNSPRNLSTGLVLLVLLAGARWSSARSAWGRKALGAVLVVAGVAAAIHGVGSVMSTFGAQAWPKSTAAVAIRRDSAGWRDLGSQLATGAEPIFAVDYSLAAQVQYYSGRPAYTSWGQYALWGIPMSADWAVVSLGFVPEDLVRSRLESAFEMVSGPQYLRAVEWGSPKEVQLWEADGLRIDTDELLQRLDLLTLVRAAGQPR